MTTNEFKEYVKTRQALKYGGDTPFYGRNEQ